MMFEKGDMIDGEHHQEGSLLDICKATDIEVGQWCLLFFTNKSFI